MVSIISLFRRAINWDSSSETQISENSLNSLIVLANKAMNNNNNHSSPVENRSKCPRKNSASELSKYKMLRVLGQGSFGKVVLVRHIESQQLFAMKIIKKNKLTKKNHITRLITEKSILQNIDSPFVTKFHATFQTITKLYIVMEFCPGGELFFHLSRNNKFPERIVQFIAAEILLSFEAIHKQGYIYRDLKPENVLFDADGHIRLCDFGLACGGISSFFQGSNSICGTPEYMSPEMLTKADYGFCVDYWAFGMIIYELLTGLPPWYTRDRTTFFQRVRSAPLTFPSYVSDDAQSFIKGLLSRKISSRYGASGAEQLKSHPFFNGINWEIISRKNQSRVPFNPCLEMVITPNVDDNLIQTNNFDEQFTRMSLHSENYEESSELEPIWIDNFDSCESNSNTESYSTRRSNPISFKNQSFTATATQTFVKLSCSA